jgi:hypothetical protein
LIAHEPTAIVWFIALKAILAAIHVWAPNAKVVLMGYPSSTPDDSTPPRARWVCRPAVPLPLVAGGALFVLVAAIAGCGNILDPKQQALDKATAAVRANARQARVEVEATLRDPGTGQEQPVDRAARVLEEQISKGIGGRVARKSTRSDGTVDLEATFIEHRDSGGGLSYEGVAVLLCVRLSGKPGPRAEVELADAPCPTNVTSKPPNFGGIDKVVTLK